MNLYSTFIHAIDPVTGELTQYNGPLVPGINEKDAQHYCDTHALGYCWIDDQVTGEIPASNKTFAADWKNKIDYDNFKNN